MKANWHYAVLILVITMVLATILNFVPIPSVRNQSTTSLPEIHISLANTTLPDILTKDKETKYPGNSLTLINAGDITTYNNLELKGRGNSTWGWPKSPFQIKFSEKTDLFNMGAAKKWILLANYLDKSNLRTDIAFYVAGLLEQDYAISGQFVELFIDNDYLGLYYLTEKIELAKNRVDLSNEDAIIVELDNLHAATDLCEYLTDDNSCLNVKDLRVESNKDRAFSTFTAKFSALEQAAKNHDYEQVKSLADVESFAKYYLLSDFTVNPDSYASSFYFYLDGPDDKIHAGPSWDFDLSLSNYVWGWAQTDDFYSPETIRTLETHALGGSYYDKETDSLVTIQPNPTHSHLLFDLYQIPEFETEIQTIYRKTLMHKKQQVLSYIEAQATIIRESAIEDRALWRNEEPAILHAMELIPGPIHTEGESLGDDTAGNPYDENTLLEYQTVRNKVFRSNLSPKTAFDQDVAFLLDWVSRRFDYLDHEYGGMKSLPNFLATAP